MDESRQVSHVGIFDSGLGGLTVVRALAMHAPQLDITYFGDTARVPYGSKGASIVTRYATENTERLLSEGVELIIVACNTATAYALSSLQAWCPVPVLGVVQPGARAVAAVTRGKVGVMGTRGTVRSGVYPKAIESLRPGTEVKTVACPLFVPLVEEGYAEHAVTRCIAEEYLAELGTIDTLLLGCTHYPRLRGLLSELLGPEVNIVDSAEAIAACVGGSGRGHRRYLVSDEAESFALQASAFLGHPLQPDEVLSVQASDAIYS